MLRTSKLLMKIHDAGTGLLCSLSEPFEGYEGTCGTVKMLLNNASVLHRVRERRDRYCQGNLFEEGTNWFTFL